MTTALADWVYTVHEIGPNGISETRAATEEERLELARELDILACERLSVSYKIEPRNAGRFAFSGRLTADVTQACVVSLEPVPARVEDEFAITLSPPSALEDEFPVGGEREVSSVPDTEPITDGGIEAGKLVYEILSAGLDPYPRKPGVEFDWVDPKLKDAGNQGPFAALAKLKRET